MQPSFTQTTPTPTLSNTCTSRCAKTQAEIQRMGEHLAAHIAPRGGDVQGCGSKGEGHQPCVPDRPGKGLWSPGMAGAMAIDIWAATTRYLPRRGVTLHDASGYENKLCDFFVPSFALLEEGGWVHFWGGILCWGHCTNNKGDTQAWCLHVWTMGGANRSIPPLMKMQSNQVKWPIPMLGKCTHQLRKNPSHL